MLVFSYLFHYNTFLQNVIDIITKYDTYFITKCGNLNYKMQKLLENAAVITNLTFTANCDSATVNSVIDL